MERNSIRVFLVCVFWMIVNIVLFICRYDLFTVLRDPKLIANDELDTYAAECSGKVSHTSISGTYRLYRRSTFARVHFKTYIA